MVRDTATSEVAVSLTIESAAEWRNLVRELEPFGTIEVEDNHSIVSIVGNEITQTPHVLSRLFESLDTIPIRMVSYGGSRHNVTLLIPSTHKTETLRLLNKGLFGLE